MGSCDWFCLDEPPLSYTVTQQYQHQPGEGRRGGREGKGKERREGGGEEWGEEGGKRKEGERSEGREEGGGRGERSGERREGGWRGRGGVGKCQVMWAGTHLLLGERRGERVDETTISQEGM